MKKFFRLVRSDALDQRIEFIVPTRANRCGTGLLFSTGGFRRFERIHRIDVTHFIVVRRSESKIELETTRKVRRFTQHESLDRRRCHKRIVQSDNHRSESRSVWATDKTIEAIADRL